MASYPSVSVSATNATATGLTQKLWSKKLAMRAMPEDIFFKFGGVYNGKTKSIPNSIYITNPAGIVGAHTVTFPLLMPLSTDAGTGTGTDPLTNAEQQTLRQFVAYYNDYDKSVKSFASGIEYLDGQPYALLEQVTPQIALFLKQLYGFWVRYAMINGVSQNLLSSPTSLSVVPHPNTLVKGVPLDMQPSERYTNNSALMASIIAGEFANVPATTSGAMDCGSVLAAGTYFTENKPLLPLSIGGMDCLIQTVPSSQKDYLMNSSNADGLGAVWSATSRYANKDIADLPNVMGQIGNMVLVQDPLAPRAKAYGTGSGSDTASATNAVYVDAYMKPGFVDQRTALGTTDVMECSFILGAGSFVDLEPEPAHYESESQYLKKVEIKGALGSRGFSRIDYEKSTPTTTSKINQSSGLYWFRQQVVSQL